MVHTYPEEFIPVGDAFRQALFAIEDCAALLRSIDEAKTNAERGDLFDKYDAMARRVERRVRDAIAYEDLPPFVRRQNGQFERLVDRESFRKEAFGMPGIENVAHRLTNPGPDIGGRPVFLKSSDFEHWLKIHRLKKNRRTGRPIGFDWPDAQNFAAKLFAERGEFQEWDSEWKGQADLERQVLSYMEKTLGSGKGPGESTLRSYVSKWLKEWREGQ